MPWLSASYLLSMAGVFLAGAGIGLLYPLAASMMLATAPGQAGAASGRLVLASGTAMLVAPLMLGVIADAADVVVAWGLVLVLCLVSLALTVPVARDRARLGPGAG